MRYVVMYALVAPSVILTCTALSIALPQDGAANMGNPGPHGLTELIYAYTSNTQSNGSAMSGFNGATDFHNGLMVVAMLLGRYVPIAFVLALAGRLGRQQPGVVTAGTLRASGINFVTLATGAALILALLNFLPRWPSGHWRKG